MVSKKKEIVFEVSENQIFIAIASDLDEFRFCNEINTEFSVDLEIQPAIELITAQGVSALQPYYTCADSYRFLNFDLISNKLQNGVVCDFLPTISYILRISNISSPSDTADIVKRLQALDSVLLVQKIEIEKLKAKHQKMLLHLFI